MQKYQEMTKEELLVEQAALEKQFEEIKALNLKLDMSRGKPSAEQLDLSMDMLDVLDSKSVLKGEKVICAFERTGHECLPFVK